MGNHAQGRRMTADSNNRPAVTPADRSLLWGPFTLLGLAIAAATAVVDQATKLWLIFPADIGGRGRVTLAPFLDLVLTWNKGISYGLFPQEGPFGQWALLALKAIAAVLLWIWLARATSRLTAVSLGLIIGGAIGNAIDRLAYGAVADFLLFHITTQSFDFNWYVFNLADVAIVAGVVGLLYETLVGPGAAKAP
jgi:signal peptidase II